MIRIIDKDDMDREIKSSNFWIPPVIIATLGNNCYTCGIIGSNKCETCLVNRLKKATPEDLE